MKRILLILGLCLISLWVSAGVPAIYYVQLKNKGVDPTDLSDYTYIAELVSKPAPVEPGDIVKSGDSDNCTITKLPIGVFVKIDAQRFKNSFTEGAQIKVTVTQKSTGKIAEQIITVSKLLKTEYFIGNLGIDIDLGEI